MDCFELPDVFLRIVSDAADQHIGLVKVVVDKMVEQPEADDAAC